MEIAPASGGGQHGLSFDRLGRRLVCSNSDHLQLIMYEDRYVAQSVSRGAAHRAGCLAAEGPQATVYRASPVEPWRLVRTRLRVKGLVEGPVEGGGRAAGYFTAATGVTVYRGDAFGPDYDSDVFVADCGSNIIHRKKLHAGRRRPEGQAHRLAARVRRLPRHLVSPGADGQRAKRGAVRTGYVARGN